MFKNMSVFIFLLFIIIPKCIYSQITVLVFTDTSVYEYQEDIHITITAYNGTNNPITLSWGDLYNSNYYIDNYQPIYFVPQVPVSITLAPDSSYSWLHIHEYIRYPVSPGTHFVRGEVVNYGISQPIVITVLHPLTVNDISGISKDLLLLHNFPNPFNSQTTIEYNLSEITTVEVCLYDLKGELIKVLYKGKSEIGINRVVLEGDKLSSGIYIYQVKTKKIIKNSKCVFLK